MENPEDFKNKEELQGLYQDKAEYKSEEFFVRSYEHAIRKGFFDTSITLENYRDLTKKYETELKEKGRNPSEILASGELSKIPQLISFNMVFGRSEPAYLELVGGEEIARLREKTDSQFLLLGSQGRFSTRGFTSFAKKINPSIRSNVIDIDSKTAEVLKKDSLTTGAHIVAGDALSMPYHPESMDHVYSNFLLHYLGDNTKVEDRIKQLFAEIYIVLKPGGSYVAVERRFGEYSKHPHDEEMQAKLIAIAEQHGLIVSRIVHGSPQFTFLPEYSSSKIDENGRLDCTDSFVETRVVGDFCIRFSKPD